MQGLFTMPNVYVLLQFLQECNFYTNIWSFYSFKCFKHSLSNSIFYWFLWSSAEIFWVHRVSTLARAVRKLQIWQFFNNSRRRYMAIMLPIWNETPKINQLIWFQYGWWKKCMFCLLDNWNTPNNSLTKGYASKVFVTNFILFAAAVFSLSEAIYQRCYNIHGWTGWYIIVRHTATSYIVHCGSGKVKIILLQSSVCKF